jgi:uncharacterized protein YeaO (DUF488 family)
MIERRDMIKTKHYREPVEPDDGDRISIAIHPPGKYTKFQKTLRQLTPSSELHTQHQLMPAGHKTDCDCPDCEKAWKYYVPIFRDEMKSSQKAQEAIQTLAYQCKTGDIITLLCWCHVNEKVKHCHRIIIKELIDKEVSRRASDHTLVF